MMTSRQVSFAVRIKEGSFIARLAAWKLRSENVAIVLGKTIHLHNTSYAEFVQNKAWVCHELKHIQQFQRHGYILFIFLYLRESILHGYRNNKYEIEARDAENDESLLKTFKIAEKGKTQDKPH